MREEIKQEAMCTICHRKALCRHFDMYVFGSEGIELCHDCEMDVYGAIRERIYEHMRQLKRSIRYNG